MMLVTIWLVASVAIGAIAPSRNRSFFGRIAVTLH